MRLSLRKVVKYSTFLSVIFVLNVWVSYNVNFWSFNNFSDRGKVLKTLSRRDVDDGGAWPSPPHDSGQQLGGDMDAYYKHRSAKSFNGQSVLNSKEELKQNFGPDNRYDSIDRPVDRPLVAAAVDTGGEGTQPQEKDGDQAVAEESDPSLRRTEQPHKSLSKTRFPPTQLNDIFISVKTTMQYHQSRIQLLLKTWHLLAKDQVYFFSDGEDSELKGILGDRFVNTNCSADHSRRSLSCKMASEIDFYMASRKRWFCHMDDDVYLNVPRLVEVLQQYNHRDDWYLGKPSLRHPLEVTDRENPGMKIAFWFATGGAGFCISRSLALKMSPYASGGRFMTTAETIRLPDDCTLGFIIEHLLKKELTVVNEFHSHLEPLWLIKSHQIKDQITLSFSETSGKQNRINVKGFSVQDDPTRFRSLHCFLFPNFRECREIPAY